MTKFILAIDQGTTSSRALLFDLDGKPVAIKQKEFQQHFPADGWVEHDATEIWETTLWSCRAVMAEHDASWTDISCIGITNQRETSVIWDKASGAPLSKAIVWQDRRTAEFCNSLRDEYADEIQQKTGLLLDPYFSATKFRWLLDNVPEARQKAEAGQLAIGTIDTYLLWKLTDGKSYFTDATNASRTMLFNIKEQSWDERLLKLFEIPQHILPEVKDCGADYGFTDKSILGGAIPITGVMGDQQAAAFGQCCFEAGSAKSTYGTGGFLLINTGKSLVYSSNRLLSTIAYRLNGSTHYAIEGSIFMAGATIQWLRDKLQILQNAGESEMLARQVPDDLSVYLIPAFTGLGAPYWDPEARGALLGMTRDTGIPEIVAAGLMSVVYQTKDLVNAISADGAELSQLRVDGGLSANNFVLEKLADILDCEVHRPKVTETTAQGAAYVAGLQSGVFSSLEQIKQKWQIDKAFKPTKDTNWRENQYLGWKHAIQKVIT